MIVYYKLANVLKERNMTWKDLRMAGLSQNMPTRFSKNENINSDTINKVCEYLQVQPSEIMEWIPDAEYNKVNEEKQAIEAQIAELQAKLKTM
jgi:DNA-binding Xre family transcriptional regulator|nr:MAG TPA: Cro/C1-type HTH DNA-binding domain protein [Bacteriophage sp.]DAS83209.1 MAG TPA: Cro/C1-type HTH DNA-binding domain protein [Caudoviricetes sp.]DAZ80697.1 MAG TPA: Cro/C1-type HTH DNA-binding domain protein [Caudoviricetes sp.]